MKHAMRMGDDFHVHLRREPMLSEVLPFTSQGFRRAVIMPNTTPPILNGNDVRKYRREILDACMKQRLTFEPLMTIQLTMNTTREDIASAAEAGAVAAKLYPQGVTTNSENGIKDIAYLYNLFESLENNGLLLLIHGQEPGVFCLDREKMFLPHVKEVAKQFPNLKIVLEHISTREAVEMVKRLPRNVAATITAHHLALTLDDVLCYKCNSGREGLNPHHYCQPIPQRPEDRSALLAAATSGSPKFFFGSDTAPHLQENKECGCGYPGVFSAPVVLPVLAHYFEHFGALDVLENFVSVAGAKFYGLRLNERKITLEKIDKAPWQVPEKIGGIVPFMAGKFLNWKIAETIM